jgi:hypothetical protein
MSNSENKQFELESQLDEQYANELGDKLTNK